MPRLSHRFALAWLLILAGYMLLMSWVPFGHWNYQPCCPVGLQLLRRGDLSLLDALGTLMFVMPAAVFWLGARRAWPLAMWISVAGVGVWLVLQLVTWWPPYLFGASEQWSRVYARAFAQSTRILPRWNNHLPPDGMHLVLQVILCGSVVSGASAALRQARSAAGSRLPSV